MGGEIAHPLGEIERAAARILLCKAVDDHREDIVHEWMSAAGDDAINRFPDLQRHLRSLLSGLYEVWRDDDWSLTQTIIDALAEKRARMGVHLESGLQRALLAGRRALRPYYDDLEVDSDCDEVLLETLHECVFRFSESYQGIRLTSENERVHTRVIKSLVMALEARDPYTTGHSINVGLLAQRVAQGLGDAVDASRTYLAGLLHDVGKVGVPDSILSKPGALNDAEWEIMHSHPQVGATILRPIRLYPDVVSAVLSHHENYDGSGYPNGLSGEEIPVIARILRAVDSFEAMTSSRAYRSGLSIEHTLNELMQLRGSSYDPDVIDALTRVVQAPSIVRELSQASLQVDLGDISVRALV